MIDNDFELIDIVTGYQRAAVVTAACDLRLFDALATTPHTVAELARRLDIDESNLEALLVALVGTGLVTTRDGTFAATPYAAERLVGGTEMALVVAKEAVFAEAWLDLTDVVRTGRPTMESWRSRLESNPQQARSFLEALDVLARISGPPIVDIDALTFGRRVLDVGGGLGTYARMLQAAGSMVTLVDLPTVISWATETLEGTGVELVAADVMEEPACGVAAESMDAALVSHMLHDRPVVEGTRLLQRVRDALVPSGHVVVNDFAGDSGPGDFGPLFDVMMRVETPGASHPRATLHSMLEEAGFIEVRTLDFDEPLTVLTGRKP